MAEQADKKIIVVDSQRLSMIQTCDYKYDLVFNKRYVPAEKAFALERGSTMHILLEQYYTLRKYQHRWGMTCPYHPKRAHGLLDIIKICIRVYEYFALRQSITIEEIDDCIRVFKEYVEFYQNEPHQTLAVEEVGSRIMYEDDQIVIIYETKIDWITQLTNIPVLPWDHKTYSRRGPVNPLADQFMGYCWMLKVNNIGINRIGFQTTVKPMDKFMRPILSYSQRRLDGWVDNAVAWIMHLHRCFERDHWKQNLTSCDKFQGCMFQEVCITEPGLRDWKARSLFEISKEPWDVGAKL